MALKIRSIVRLEDAFQTSYIGNLELPIGGGESSRDTFVFVLAGWVHSRIGETLEEICLRYNHLTLATTSISLSRPDAETYLKQIGIASPTEACGFHAELEVGLSLFSSPVTFDITVLEASGQHFPIYRLTVEHNTELQPHRTAIRPLLLTTLGRTGSTWLSALLALHPEVLCHGYEPRLGLYWLSAFATISQPKSYLRKYDALDLADSQWWLGGQDVHTEIGRSDDETERQLGFLSAQRFSRFVGEELSAHYSAIAARQGKSATFFVEKYLPNLYPELMSRVVMGSKEVFLVRDWRDMVASIESYSRQRGMDLFGTTREASRSEQIHAQVEAVEMMRVAWEQRQDTALLVRYEDLVTDLPSQTERILRYLEVDTNPATLSIVLEDWVGRSCDFEDHRTTPSLSASIGRWKTDLSPEEGALATELYYDSLVAFGYETPEYDLHTLSLAAPFPPLALMHRVSGLTNEPDFAQHGRDLFFALDNASPKSLFAFQSILDFGVGSGRLARMFKNYHGSYYGADIDHELIDWVRSALPSVTPLATEPRMPLPYADGQFDCVISISVFSHMNEEDADFYLKELHRITCPGALLFLTIHGQRALDRALTESKILDMLAIPHEAVSHSSLVLQTSGFSFVLQAKNFMSESYEYGMTFISENYVRSEWAKLFMIEQIHLAKIYDFQDIVVLRRQ